MRRAIVLSVRPLVLSCAKSIEHKLSARMIVGVSVYPIHLRIRLAVSSATSLENAKKIPFPPLKSKDTAQQHISSQVAQLEELRSLMTSKQQVVQDDRIRDCIKARLLVSPTASFESQWVRQVIWL